MWLCPTVETGCWSTPYSTAYDNNVCWVLQSKSNRLSKIQQQNASREEAAVDASALLLPWHSDHAR